MTKRNVSEQERVFKQVGVKLRRKGIAFRINVMECCRGCVSYEKLGAKSEQQPYGFIYGGQGNRVRWNENGELVSANPSSKRRSYYGSIARKIDHLYVNHGNGSAKEIVSAFREDGFDVEWDGNEYSCVKISF